MGVPTENRRAYGELQKIEPRNPLEDLQARFILSGYILAGLEAYQRKGLGVNPKTREKFITMAQLFITNPDLFQVAAVDGSSSNGICLSLPQAQEAMMVITYASYKAATDRDREALFEGIFVEFGRPTVRRPISSFSPILPTLNSRMHGGGENGVSSRLLFADGGKMSMRQFVKPEEFNAIARVIQEAHAHLSAA